MIRSTTAYSGMKPTTGAGAAASDKEGDRLWGANRADKAYLNILRNTVMISAFVKSMKNAPTMGTTRKARGDRP